MKSNVPFSPSSESGASSGTGVVQEPQIIEFPAGIPGFETCRRFVLLGSPELAPLRCLQALDPPEASFLAIDPLVLDPAYDLTLREFERARLGAGPEPLLWLAIVSLSAEGATANLQAPVVINPRRMVGCQFIRDDGDYPVRFRISLE